MSHFFKTELGQNALQQRNIALTAKQRRLLLLIDHEDFQELDHNYKEKIAPEVNRREHGAAQIDNQLKSLLPSGVTEPEHFAITRLWQAPRK